MNIKKFISLVTAICFVSLSFSDIIYCQYPADVTKPLSEQNLGSVTYSNIKDPQNVVINIQDLHGNSQVQKNIYSILKQLSEKNDIKAIYLEGASDKVDVSRLQNPDKTTQTEVSDILLNMGILTGTEYFVLNDTKNIPLYGLENKKVHQDNINRLSLMINDTDFVKEKLLSIKKDLTILSNRFVNSQSKNFSNLINSYKTKEIDTLHFYSALINYVDTISKNPNKYNNLISLQKEDYPDLYLFRDMLALETKINKKKLPKEIQNVLATIKENLTIQEYKNFLNVTGDTKNLINYINRFCSTKNINLAKKYPNIHLMIQYQTKSENINLANVLKQEQLIINNIKSSLSFNSTEYEISFLNDFYVYLESALTNNLTAKDCDYFNKSVDKFEKLYPKYVVYNQLNDIKKDIDNSKVFYQVNNERNFIFLEKIKDTLNKNPNGKNVIVAITGGYHSEGLSKLLEQSNISFISVTPNTAALNNNSNIYNNVINEESLQYSKETLAFTIASQMPDAAFIKILISAGLQNKVPYDQIKQICKNIFKENFTDSGTSFTVTINEQPFTVEQEKGYAVFNSDITGTDESLGKDLSVLTQDIISEDGNSGLKLLLNLLNIINRYQPFDTFSLTTEDKIFQEMINTLVFFVENLNVHFSNGFERTDIEEYVNNEIAQNDKRTDKTLNGIDINTARYLPGFIQSVLYENDKSEKQIQRRIKKAKQKVIDDIETNFLEENYDGSLQISGLISIIIKEILSFAKDFDFKTFDSASKPYLLNFIDISKALTYLTVSAFSLDNENTKGISLNQGLIGISRHLQYGTLVESMGHEFAHEMLLLMKDFHPSGSTKNLAHETHSFIFSLLFAQIFNEMLQASFSEEQGYRDYSKFIIDLDEMFKNTVDRNITRNSQSLEEVPFIHIPSLNFIKILNRCFDKDGKIMSLENLTYLAQTVREVFSDDNFKNLSYSTVFYIILMEFAKKVNSNSVEIINKYFNDIVNFTKVFTMNEADGDYLLIESFAAVLLTGTAQDIETFITDKIIVSKIDKQEYKSIIRKIYEKKLSKVLNITPDMYDVIDEIFFTILGTRTILLKNKTLPKEITDLTDTIIKDIIDFKGYCDLGDITFNKEHLEKLLKILKEQENIENLPNEQLIDFFIKTFNFIYNSSTGRFSIIQTNSDIYTAINKVLPQILQKHNKVINLSSVINLILNPSVYQSIDITKEILKADNDLEEFLDILTELFVTLVRDYGISFNTGITSPEIKDFAADRQSVADLPKELFSKLPAFIQEILFDEATTTIVRRRNDFTMEYFLPNKKKTNALLKLILQETFTLLKNKGYEELLSIENTKDIMIFSGRIASGVSNGKNIAINPADESFLNVAAHELGHILFTAEGFSQYKSTIVHELFAYSLGLLTTTAFNDTDIKTEKFLPVTYENIIDSDEHSLPKTLLQLVIDAKGRPLNEREILVILNVCKTVMKEDIFRIDNISLAYKILDILEKDSYFMRDLLPNSITMKLETALDEPQERKAKILQQLFNVDLPENILITDKETFIRNTEESPVYISRKVINEIFDKDGNLIEGKDREFYYLTELVRLQVLQQYSSTKQERVNDFEKLHMCFEDLERMSKYPPFSKYSVTFKKEVNRMSMPDGKELIYINPEYLKKIGLSKYSEYLTNLIILRSLEKKFNSEFKANANFDFYVNIDNLDDIEIDLQKFTNAAKPLEYLKQVYDEHLSKQEKTDTAIDKILARNRVRDTELFKNKIKDLMFIAENPNIEFTSIEFFRILSANINHSVMQQIYENLIDVYTYLIRNNLFTFNSSFNEEIKNYVVSEQLDNLDGVEIQTALQMPAFIQKMLYENARAEENFTNMENFAKQIKYKKDNLNGLLNIISHDIANIVASIYPEMNTDILSAQIFFASLQRLTYGANYGNHNIAVSRDLINRYKNDPNALTIEILKTVSHELGHEELFLRGVDGNTNLINTLHEFYAYLFETLFIKAYSQRKGIRETESVFTTAIKQSPLNNIADNALTIAVILSDFALGKKDEHDQALDILAILQQDEFKEFFPKEKIIETFDIIDTLANEISFEDDGITKILRVDDLNMQALSFFILMFMFGGEIDLSYSKLLALSKSISLFNTKLFDEKKVLEALIRKDFESINHLIDTILVKGDARTKELNELLFNNETFEFEGKQYGYSITSNRSENGLLKDDKILIYFTPNEIKFLITANDAQLRLLKRKAKNLTSTISDNPQPFMHSQKVTVITRDSYFQNVKRVLEAPVKRALAITSFTLDVLTMFTDLLKEDHFKNSKSINVVYYDDIDDIEPNKDILSVFVSEKEIHGPGFEVSGYTINGRNLRIYYNTEDNLIMAYCPQASKQEIIEMTAKYIKSTIASPKNNVTLKNIVIDSNVLPDTITYHLSQENEGFACVSSTFMELGLSFIEDLLKLDDIESVMFSKQIYDYVGSIPFKQLSKILQDTSLNGSQIIIDSDIFSSTEMAANKILFKTLLESAKLEIIVKISSQEEAEQIYNEYGISAFMFETQKDDLTIREIVEFEPSQGMIQKAPVSYIELTDLTNIEDRLENIPSHQAIVISVNADDAKNINLSDNMILSSLKATLTRILKSKTISTKTASNMGKELAKQVNISDEEKENIANRYNEIKKSLTIDNLSKLENDFPDVFTSEVTSYIEKLFEQDSEEITPAIAAFIDAFLNDILYDDNLEDLQVTINLDNDIKHYKSILSAA
ncbi:hypothetical protein [Candidatus Ruminimicrobiellum ovillum]|uniref:hypothetical protein n=1 Tax=Candidatus Ruminimicrobiellum ovillum TaxID=1947927 RepID=UPI003559F13C